MEIIIPHVNTDLDALGAAIGAQVLYPGARIVLPGPTSPLAGEFISLHRYHLQISTPGQIDLARVRRAIVVDTADPARLGPLKEAAGRAEVHLYDHHPPDVDDVAATLVVRDLVGSTCTLIAELIEEAGAPLTPLQATAMLLGIYADTGNLRYMGTTDRDARAAAFLLARGANLRALDRFIQGAMSPAQEALLHQLQARSRWVEANEARIRVVDGETPEYIGGLGMVVHRLQEVLPAPALFAVVRMESRVHIVGRSEVPWVDVASVAAAFGGGGHPGAASAVVKGGELAAVAARLQAVLAEKVQRPQMAMDVMSAPVKAVVVTKPVREAERLMLRHGHSGLPVVDEAGHLAGIVSLRDVENARRHGLEHAPVKGIMNKHVVTVTPRTPLDQVQERMVERDIGRVPVVDGGNLVGIVSRSDLLGLLYGGPAPRWHRTLYADAATLAAGADPEGDERRVEEALERLSPALRHLFRTAGAVAAEAGVAVYVVGGFVRDLLLGRRNLDVDLVVEGDGIVFARALATCLKGSIQEVPRFGTAHIFMEPETDAAPRRIDVATARREFYEHAAALPMVEHANLREDLYRRDFSINAMAIRLGPHGPSGLVDFFGGMADMAEGKVRILHTLSFVEDPTRILRAIRFAVRYGFTLEPETEQCARRAVTEGFVDRLTLERLRNELLLMLKEARSREALEALDSFDILRRILPGVSVAASGQMLDRLEEGAAEAAALWAGAPLYWAKLLALVQSLPLAAGVRAVGRLKLKREEAQPLLHAVACWRMALDALADPKTAPADIVRVLDDWSQDGLVLLYLLGGGERVLRYWREWRHVKLGITGHDLTAAGLPPGPQVGRVLSRVLSDRLDGRAPDRESQLALALRYANEED